MVEGKALSVEKERDDWQGGDRGAGELAPSLPQTDPPAVTGRSEQGLMQKAGREKEPTMDSETTGHRPKDPAKTMPGSSLCPPGCGSL